ncbi:MAG: threonine synthase [Micavibrio sp.]
MTIRYLSTRGDPALRSFTEILLSGLAPDGGLYVPDSWPKIDLAALEGRSYSEIAFEIISPFVGGDIPKDDLRDMISRTYNENFRHEAIAPLVQVGDNEWVLELFHGPTIAFKDYALQLVGRLFDYVLEKTGRRATIVGATSGDTGSAAIEGVKACRNIDIFILHPEGRTSEVQRRQMTTIDAPNVHNIALKGTFDDCQDAVKTMFADEKFRAEMNLSAVNSINFARIAAQIVYYFTASVALGAASGRKISFAVPTGNFGNIYAAYCARQMGLPIDRLIAASNRNDILTRFFKTGEMKASAVEPSLSPSMDIQISSNFERFLFDLLGRDAKSLRAKMEGFKQSGSFTLDDGLMEKARTIFSAHCADDDQTLSMMGEYFKKTGYMPDPHTAVGFFAGKMEPRNPAIPLVMLACAHPAKFPDAAEKATGVRPPLPHHMADLYDLKENYSVLENDPDVLKNFIKERVSS